MKENNHILQPLILTTTTTTITDDQRTTLSILLRLSLLFTLGIICVWANHEASKGFDITIVNDDAHTPWGQRFNLLFVKNDKAIRIILNTSSFAENILYPHQHQPKKSIQQITLRFTSHKNLTNLVIVNANGKHEYVVNIRSSIMEEANIEEAMVLAVQRGMARVWLWDGEDSVPETLIQGMVEYVVSAIGYNSVQDSVAKSLSGTKEVCWKDKEAKGVANFLRFCEKKKKGFIGRLNQAMKDGWDERMIDDALGLPTQELCTSYYSSAVYKHSILW